MISLSRSAFRIVVALSALIPQSVFAQPVLTPWDACAPINRQQTRQYLSLIWQAEINGHQIDLSQFEFANDLPNIMGLLVAPQKEVFERLYEHRLDPNGLSGDPYGLNELMRDDPLVRAQFREFVLTDKVTLGPDSDPQAANKHLLMIIDGVFAQTEFKVEAFQFIGNQVESTKLEVIKNYGTVPTPLSPPTNPDQFGCDVHWWAKRAFFECMNDNWTHPKLYLPENHLDPSDPNWQKKRRPVPRFDCDDFTDAMIQWLKRRLEEIYGPGSIKFQHIVFAWQCPEPGTNPTLWKNPVGHSMPLLEHGGKFYLVDPYTGAVYGPYNTREEAHKKALELFMTCPGGRPVGNPDYWQPGERPGWEPKPWWTDWEMQKRFCERLKACCGWPLPTPPNCTPSTSPGGTAPSATPCDFRDYMPPNTFVAPRANCDQ